MSHNVVVKPPPRVEVTGADLGALASIVRVLVNWLHEFYSATVVESGLLDPAYQADSSTFNPDNPPDPDNSSIALAQATANEALRRVKLLENP